MAISTIDSLTEAERHVLYRKVAEAVSSIQFTPSLITAVYIVFGFVALYVSDVLLVQFFSDPVLSQLQALKGGIEILLTAGLILGLTYRSHRQYQTTSRELERQSEELQLLHRVLRHNLRNDLNIIWGYTDMLAADSERSDERCERILSTVDKMMRYTEKAHRIREVSELKKQRIDLDVPRELPDIIEDRTTAGIDVSTTLPEECLLEVHPMVPAALGEVIENAVRHNSGDTPRVTINADTEAGSPGMARIKISDNGPGIPAAELEALRSSEESPLRHSSKMGLWFVKWAIAHSDGDLEIHAGDTGTTVTIELPRGMGIDFELPAGGSVKTPRPD